jgi:hypothetical protein
VLTYTLAAVAVVVMAILLFASAMMWQLNHDENTYCAAGALISSGMVMYRDFAYLQMPWLPVIYAFVFNLFNTTDYLFVGRVVSVNCSILTMVLVLIVFIHAFQEQRIYGLTLGVAAVILYSFNPTIQYAFKTASIFLVGLFSGIAVFARLSFAMACLTFFLTLALLIPVSPCMRLKKLLIPFITGAMLSSILVIYYLFQAPDSFIFDTLQYFRITGAKRWFPGFQPSIDFNQKIDIGFRVLRDPSYLALLIAFFYACVLAIGSYGYLGWRKIPLILSTMSAVAMVIAAFMVTPMWPQYFAAPVPFLLIAIAYAVSGKISTIKKESKQKLVLNISTIFIVICAVLSILYGAHSLKNIKVAFSREDWTSYKVFKISKKVSEIVGSDKLILTLAPIFPLEGGGQIYQELSTGPFLFRYGSFLSDAQRQIAVSTDPHSLPALLKEKPPDAVIVGFESDLLESSLVEYAARSGWQEIRIDGYKLYVPPRHYHD